MASNSNDQQLHAAVQNYQQAPAQAVEQLKPLADAGDPQAVALIAYFYINQGQIDEGLPYAEQAVQQGYGHLAQLYAADLAQRQRPELRARVPEFARAALDNGANLDVFNLILQSAQQGEQPLVSELLESSRGPGPSGIRDRWQEILERANSDLDRIGTAATEVAGQRDQAFEAMRTETEAVEERRADAERQADELGLVTSALAAHNLADAYAKDAERTEDQAGRYTVGSLVIGVISVGVSVFGLLTVKAGSGFDTVIARAAFGLPIALLAAYVNNLATTHRREAWRLRHVELQIRTANPFLGLLDPERRRETLATLALRFFPGQDNFLSDAGGGQPSALELIDALRVLLREQQPKAVVDQAQTPSTPTAP
jgi:hypothetical protein